MMFGSNKKKLELSSEELRIMRYSINDFRNNLIKENKPADVASEVMVKLKNKMKVDKYDVGAMINSLKRSRNNVSKDKTDIDDLLLKLVDVYDSFKKK